MRPLPILIIFDAYVSPQNTQQGSLIFLVDNLCFLIQYFTLDLVEPVIEAISFTE
jgi:hypothetical protein